jgi:thymidylate synthase
MLILDTRNADDAYGKVCRVAMSKGVKQDSRNGPVVSVLGPTIVKFKNPRDRVLIDPVRDANPFFHLFESLWMLAGSNEVSFIQNFNKQIGAYSDDGETFNAAYGHRWRRYFGYDQIAKAIGMLRDNKYDRRVVITQWDPRADLGSESLDIPCNQQIMPRVYENKLNFLTTNRSNDAVWGLCGANMVHLTVLMEVMAHAVGLPLGEWVHVTNNLHIYERHWDMARNVQPLQVHLVRPKSQPLLAKEERYEDFITDCEDFIAGQDDDFRTEFFDGTVAPMIQGYHKWKRDGDKAGAIYDAQCIEADDWRRACVAWLRRRK